MNIRLKALSIALFSLAWATQAQANWSGSGCTSPNNGECTISGSVSGSVSGSGNLTISDGASISSSGSGSNTINASGTFTITNHGTVTSSNPSVHAIKVTGTDASGTITNSSADSITGNWNGISIETGSGGSGTIEVNNTGTITGTQGRGIFVSGSGTTVNITNSGTIAGAATSNSGNGVGIQIQAANSGSTITTSGTVTGYHAIKTGSHIKSIDVSDGVVSGGYYGIYLENGVDTLTIGSGARVTASVQSANGFQGQQYEASAIQVRGNVTSLTNNGYVAGVLGVSFVNELTVAAFNNAGTIESTGPQRWNSAINIMSLDYKKVTIEKLVNQSTGVIKSPYGNAIGLEVRNDLNELVNQGTIEAGYDALQFFNADFDSWAPGSGGYVGKITLENGSRVKAGHIAFNLEPQTQNGTKATLVKVGTIDIQSGANIEAGSYGIVLGQSATLTESIQISGSLTTGNSPIYNKGLIGESGHSGTVITIASNSIAHSAGSTIENPGTINGDILVKSGVSGFSFANPGTLNGKLIIEGDTKVDINDWNIHVSADEATGQAKADTITINTAKPENITIHQVSINDLNESLLGKNISFEEAFKTSGGHTIQIAQSADAVKVGSLPSSLGFDGTYDPDTKTFYTSFNVAQTAGAVVSQTLANQLMRRDFFLESAITEAATGSLYHRKLEGVEGTAFIKPYASSDTFDLDGAKLDGSTQGVMLGINRFVGRHLLTGFVGYERSEIDSDFRSSTMNLDVQSWYGGFNTAHLLQSNPLVDTFLKGSLKASYTTTGIDRSITLNANTTGSDNTIGSNMSVINSSAKPNTVAIGMNVQMGMNFKPMKETQIIPMVGLGYSIGKTSSYQLDRTGLINDSYMPERVMMPYADASVTWFQGWGKIVRTFVGGGMRYILDRTQKTALSYGKLPIEGEYSLPQSFQYVNASMVLHITHHSEIAVGYTGVFDSTGHSQNLTTKYELHF